MNSKNKKTIKFSIITVCYNSEKTIKQSLESVESQQIKEIEHIIIDGGSSDKTLSIIKKNFRNIQKIISEPDKGVYDAMNKGIEIAKGDIIGFLNSDDFFADENVLNNVLKEFNENPSIKACYSDLIYVDREDELKNIRYWKSSKFILGSFSRAWCPPHPTFFAYRSVYKKYGKFNLNYHLASDNELMMRFLEVKKIKANYVPEVWVKMRLGGLTNRSLKNIFIQNLEILTALKKNGLSYNPIIFLFYKMFIRVKQYIKN